MGAGQQHLLRRISCVAFTGGNMKNLFLLLLCTAIASVFGSCVTPEPPNHSNNAPAPQDVAPLNEVIKQVKAALAEYQANLGGPDALPPLSTAEFDFKTTIATIQGFSVNVFVFKLGGSHEDDVVNEVIYKYSVPKPSKGEAFVAKGPPLLREALVQAIQSAAKFVKTEASVERLHFSKLTVKIEYGVVWDGLISAGVPISLVTVGPNGEKKKNTVQSVTLEFEVPQ
jgi:hypothetical protein